MLKHVSAVAVVITLCAAIPARAQAPAPPVTPPASQTPPAPETEKPSAPPSDKPAEPAPAGQTPPARGGGPTKAPQTGNPDPGVNFTVLIDNPHVRVLQVTLQPGAVRRPHVHNDVTFHVMVPVTGSLELVIEKQPVVTTVAGQAYYMAKGQTHSFTNKGSAAAQVIELFIKPDPALTPPAAEGTPPPAAPASAPAAAAPATAAPSTPPPAQAPAK